MDRGYEAIHEFRDFTKMGRYVIANIDWLLSKSPPELRDIRHRDVIKRPKNILIKRRVPLLDSNFNTIDQKVVLSYKISLLELCVKDRILFFEYDHKKGTRLRVPSLSEAFLRPR